MRIPFLHRHYDVIMSATNRLNGESDLWTGSSSEWWETLVVQRCIHCGRLRQEILLGRHAERLLSHVDVLALAMADQTNAKRKKQLDNESEK